MLNRTLDFASVVFMWKIKMRLNLEVEVFDFVEPDYCMSLRLWLATLLKKNKRQY